MMSTLELVTSYFPTLNEEQIEQFGRLEELYREWNQKINVISRKDMDAFGVHHVLHSLSIARVIQFAPGTKVMDVGTGGGFPGIPLAILFPDVEFYLIDSIGKKIKVVGEVSRALRLQNVRTAQIRAEQVKEQQDFIVSRAVTAFPAFVGFTRGKIRREGINRLANGILYLKGGDFEEEIQPYAGRTTVYRLRDFFREDYFETKKLIHLRVP